MSEPALKKQKAEDGTAVNTVTADDATAASAATSSAALSSSTHAVSSSPPTVSASSSSSKRAIGMNDDALGLQLIKQGAEGRVYSCNFFGRPAIMKERFSKQYRHPSLDQKLTQARMNQEVRCMIKAKKLPQARTAPRPDTIWTPTIYLVDEDAQRIYMERIDGKTVKDTMYTLDLTAPEHKEQALELAVRIGRGIADLHHAGVIHGDLTTSNLMLVPSVGDDIGRLVVIDFGLASVSEKNEERAVDLYVLERAFLSTHPNSEIMFEAILNTYREAFSHASKVLAWLIKVRQRGRKREMVG